MGYSISKDELKSLVGEVIEPVNSRLVKDMELNYDDSVKLLKKVGFLKLALVPFKKDQSHSSLVNNVKYIEKLYNLPFDNGYVQELLGYHCDLFKNWMLKYKKKIDTSLLDEMMSNLKNIKSTEGEELTTDFDEDFFDFDSDFDDSNMEGMHYQDQEKISAKEYMDSVGIDPDLVTEMEELLESYFLVSSQYETINTEFIEELTKMVMKFITVFELSVDFRDLGVTMNALMSVLQKLENTEEIESDNKTLIKMLFDAMMEDLEKWFNEIIVEQTAKDIHYLDASLLSSAEQIRITIEAI